MTIKLTKRQTEVLHWIQQGLSNKQIAKRIGIAEATVKLHITGVLKKYGARTRTQLAMSSTHGQSVVMIPIELEYEPVAWYSAHDKAITFTEPSSDDWKPLYLRR